MRFPVKSVHGVVRKGLIKYKYSKYPFLVIMFLLSSELKFINLFEKLYGKKIKVCFSKKKDILKIFFIILCCYAFINLFDNFYRKKIKVFFLKRKKVFSRYLSLLYFDMDRRKVFNELVEYYGKILHIIKANSNLLEMNGKT